MCIRDSLLTQGNPVNSGTNSIFSCRKYSPDYQAFNGRTLTATNPLELNFNLDNCISTLVEETTDGQNNLLIFPNPSDNFIYIENKKLESKYLIYNAAAQIIKIEEISEIGIIPIDISNFPPGIYLVKCEGNSTFCAKFIRR